MSLKGHRKPSVDVSAQTDSAVPKTGEPRSGSRSRSREMVEVLRKEFLYSEKRARDILFGMIQGMVGGSASLLTVSRLTREATLRSRQHAQDIGYQVPNWNTAAKATVNAMLGAGAMLSRDGRPIRLSVAAPATEVAGLADHFEDLTEAYLLEIVIVKLGNVTTRDHNALAHALFRQFDETVPLEELIDRVVTLLAGLSDRLTLTESGGYAPIPT
jgi:hypothetical protein